MTTITIPNEATNQLPLVLINEDIKQELKQAHEGMVNHYLTALEKAILCGEIISREVNNARKNKGEIRQELCDYIKISVSQSYDYVKTFEQRDEIREAFTQALSNGESFNYKSYIRGNKEPSKLPEKTQTEIDREDKEQRVGALFLPETEEDVTLAFDMIVEAVTTGVIDNPVTGERVDLETAPKSVIRKAAQDKYFHDKEQIDHEKKMLAKDKDSEYMVGIPVQQLDELLLIASFSSDDKIEAYNAGHKAYKIPVES